NFTGGEPTFFPDFEPLVQEVKNLDYKISVSSCGGRFVDRKFCKKITPFIDQVCMSIHGHTQRLHNYHTGNPDSFKNLSIVMDNLSLFPIIFFANILLTRINLPHLKGIISLLNRKGVKKALFCNLCPEGTGLKNYPLLTPRLREIKKRLPDLIKFAEPKIFAFKMCDVPHCIFGDHIEYFIDCHPERRINVKHRRKRKLIYFHVEKPLVPPPDKIKTEKCQSCVYFDKCEGIFKEYYHFFGDEEIEAVKKVKVCEAY
ncbi:MAG: radical SAM protein, partial [Spirochaetes bacterium]|nr:radical SAM protein [Spirochaetota bacterium]